MTKRFLWILLGVLLLVSFWFQVAPTLRAEEVDLAKEVAQILKNQDKILQDLQEIKVELVKIRIRSR